MTTTLTTPSTTPWNTLSTTPWNTPPIAMHSTGIHWILERAGILQSVDPAVAARVIGQLARADFAAGETILREGDLGDRVHVILAGKAKSSIHGSGGRASLRAIMGPADLFGELSVFDPGPHAFTVTAITDVRTAWLDLTTLRAWMAEMPGVSEQLLRVLSRRLRETDDDLVEQLSSDVPARLARQLLLLGERFGKPEGDALRVMHDLSQDELAQLVGADRSSVNRVLRRFAARGWIEAEGKSTLILQPQSLTQRAAGGFTRGNQPSRRRHRPLLAPYRPRPSRAKAKA